MRSSPPSPTSVGVTTRGEDICACGCGCGTGGIEVCHGKAGGPSPGWRAADNIPRGKRTGRMKRPAQARDLFRHLTAEKASLYRSVLEAFAAAKRQYRLQLRPDEVLAEAPWEGAAPA